jgi:hypothetical protein
MLVGDPGLRKREGQQKQLCHRCFSNMQQDPSVAHHVQVQIRLICRKRRAEVAFGPPSHFLRKSATYLSHAILIEDEMLEWKRSGQSKPQRPRRISNIRLF